MIDRGWGVLVLAATLGCSGGDDDGAPATGGSSGMSGSSGRGTGAGGAGARGGSAGHGGSAASSGAAQSGAGAGGSGGEFMDCNAVTTAGAPVVGEYVEGAAPAGQGGPVADGTYDAVSFDAYVDTAPSDGRPARVFSQTWSVLDGAKHVEMVDATYEEPGAAVELLLHPNADLDTFENELTLSFTCPSALEDEAHTGTYTASGDTLVFIYDDTVMTLRRR